MKHGNGYSAMRLTLGDLLDDVPMDEMVRRLPVHDVRQDSRRVSAGDVFVAVEGLTLDGHDFAQQAVTAGAVAVVAGRSLDLQRGNQRVPCIVVADPACVLGQMSARFRGNPSENLALAGITGTNGKTTTTYALEAMLAAANKTTGLLGTVAYRWAGQEQAASHTTPPAGHLQALLAEMLAAGCSHVVMEVSSHGLQLARLCGCCFRVAAFSNLTQDHLDLHGTMQDYLKAKLRLFSQHLVDDGTAVVNLDGQGSDQVVRAVKDRGSLSLIGCSRRDQRAAARIDDLTSDLQGIRGTLHLGGRSARFATPLVGDFNADNLLLAAACAQALGVDIETICRAASQLQGVPGRLERVGDQRDFAVLVDYAHTPDALVRALEVVRPLCRGRVLVVFGCGGDRDRAKRPLMARAALQGADVVVLTSDNPRGEDPDAIIADALRPLAGQLPLVASDNELGATERGYWVQSNRAEAIAAAVRALRAGDILLVAGKGHEDYQIVGDCRHHFDDREQVRQALARRR